MSLFKIIGFIFILSSSALLGFSKALGLRKRWKKLNDICFSLTRLSQLIKCGDKEVNELIDYSFNRDTAFCEGGKFNINGSFLKKDEINLLKEFLDGLGFVHRESEIKRILFYKALFEKQLKSAEQAADSQCKLYNSLGALIGIAICIFLG